MIKEIRGAGGETGYWARNGIMITTRGKGAGPSKGLQGTGEKRKLVKAAEEKGLKVKVRRKGL